ncbi:MAG: trigger factor [Atopobiaceae bacterium]|nr:trigger factor [Atopobiaceae bacterium]
MKITVTAERPENDTVVATITVPAEEVDNYIAKAYKDIARRYQFQGFRRGRAPRPVIDGIVGREAILADATNDLLNGAQPIVLDELDIVPVERPDYGEDPALVKEHEDYVATVTIIVPPTVKLDSYDAVAINMPPAEATDAEIDMQIQQLLAYQTTYEDVEDDRAVALGDIITVDIANKEGAEDLAGTNRTMALTADSLPEELVDGIVGMKKGETKEITWTRTHMHGDNEDVHNYDVEVTLNGIKQAVTPELTDELAKKSFGFETVEELRAAVKEEIEEDKQQRLPNLKEDRVVEELGLRVADVELPEAYENQVFQELANEFLTSLQRQGMSLDMYLGARQIDTNAFLADLHAQAAERARQGLALDALALELGLEAAEDDVYAEFEKAGIEDIAASIEQFRNDGRLSALRESIRRSKAVEWLVENAEVTEVDEVAERLAQAAEETPEDAASDTEAAE